MLGCQDYCGYSDWTFQHVRSTHGQAAVEAFWSEAIGADAQRHYLAAARRGGLAALLKLWNGAGDKEGCDWTFTLDEPNNVLRWDMRRCPSRQYLFDNNIAYDPDFCDHCVHWIDPELRKAGMEVVEHEHNHQGQCWGEMRVSDKPYQTLALPSDVRRDPRWATGTIDRFKGTVKLPVLHR